jgi:hypothetical protein
MSHSLAQQIQDHSRLKAPVNTLNSERDYPRAGLPVGILLRTYLLEPAQRVQMDRQLGLASRIQSKYLSVPEGC